MAEHIAHPQDPANGDHTPFLESELTDSAHAAPARRRRVPGWLIPTVAALVAGLLVGALLFGGGDGAPTGRTAVAAPTSSTDGTVPQFATALTRSVPLQVDIPSIEVSTSLVGLGLNSDGTLEVPVNYDRAGWFTGGSYPGDPQGPPALIAGHVDNYKGPTVFYRLRELTPGDEIMVIRADNSVAVFAVTASDTFPKATFPADQVYAPVGDSQVVLITCTGAFDREARSYEDNLVVRATLDMGRSIEESDARAAAGTPVPPDDQSNV